MEGKWKNNWVSQRAGDGCNDEDTCTQRVALVNALVELVASMLRGMRVAKLSSREEGYLQRVNKIRNAELACLSAIRPFWPRPYLMVSSPVYATGVRFTTHRVDH